MRAQNSRRALGLDSLTTRNSVHDGPADIEPTNPTTVEAAEPIDAESDDADSVKDIEPFDVEQCLDFILGLRMTSLLHYQEGMAVLRTHLSARYGEDRVEQGMELIRGLLDDRENAAGLGDDGDQLAPWSVSHLQAPEFSS